MAGKRRLLSTIYVAALALLLLRLPRLGDPFDLDCGWQSMLHTDFVRGAQSGVDTVFTYGPLGWVFAEAVFAPEGLWAFAIAAIIAGLALAAALLALREQLPERWRTTWLVAAMLLGPYLGGAAPFVAIAAIGVVAAHRPSTRGGAAAMLLLAALALAKFTWFVQAAAVVVALAAGAVRSGRWRSALAWPMGFALAVVATWLLSGQQLHNLPTWWRGAVEIAAGYNDAMAAARDDGEVQWALALSALLVVFGLALFAHVRADGKPAAPRAAALGVVAASLFLCWKAGFVRQDESHSVMFFGFFATAPFLLLAAVGPTTVPRPLAAFAVAIALGAAVPLVQSANSIPSCSPLADAAQRAVDVCRLPRYLSALDTAIAVQRAAAPLPRLAARTDGRDADFMGHRQALALASGIALRHRPVFQGYSAYTPWLARTNGDFFRAADAPPFVLVGADAIGNRLPLLLDSDAWRVLLDDYVPVDAERDVLLLERRTAPRAEPVAPRTVIDRRIAVDEWVELPPTTDRHELALDFEPLARGRIASLLFRPTGLLLELRLRDGTTCTRAISPSPVRAPFVVDPLVRDSREFLAALAGSPTVRVAAFRVRGAAAATDHYAAAIGARVTATAAPVDPVDPVLTAHLDLALQFPGFALLPTRAEPDGAARPIGNGELGVRVAVPSHLDFPWPGGHRHLTVHFELLPDSYRGLVRSDGAAFRIEVAGEGASATDRRVLAERLLRPAEVTGDRGEQAFALDVDLPAGTTLALVVDPGPAGRAQYDFAAWRRLAID